MFVVFMGHVFQFLKKFSFFVLFLPKSFLLMEERQVLICIFSCVCVFPSISFSSGEMYVQLG